MSMSEIQLEFCEARGYACTITDGEEKVGVALETVGKQPVNGLRHPRKGDASGWYIWYGEQYSSDPNFFSPLHAKHLQDTCPAIVKLLGLKPGYRFLLAGDYLDIWYDDSLLEIE